MSLIAIEMGEPISSEEAMALLEKTGIVAAPARIPAYYGTQDTSVVAEKWVAMMSLDRDHAFHQAGAIGWSSR